MNLTVRKWIFAFGRWVVNIIDSASSWISIIFIAAVLGFIAATFKVVIGGHTWIILIFDLVFCIFFFHTITRAPRCLSSRFRKGKIPGVYYILFTVLIFIITATIGCFEEPLAMANIIIFPILFFFTISLSITNKERKKENKVSFVLLLLAISLITSCTWFEKKPEFSHEETQWFEKQPGLYHEEILKKDSLLQGKLDSLKTDEVLGLYESRYSYLFDRLDTYQKNGGKIKFGLKTYFVAQQDNEYMLEEILTEPVDSIEAYPSDFSFKIIKNTESDIIHGRTLEITKIPINFEYD